MKNLTAIENYDGLCFDEWVEVASNRFVPLSLSTVDRDGFSGSMRTRYVDGACVTDIAASPHSVRRLAESITDDDQHHLKLSLQIDGSGLVTQDGRCAQLRPGDAAIYDTARPYTLEYDGPMRSLVMLFPHSMLGLSASLMPTMTAVRLRGDQGIGRVICPFMQHIADDLEQLEGVNGARIVRSAFDLITALLSDELQARTTRGSHQITAHTIAQYVDAHLDDPELTTDRVARAHFISSRQLQYLMSEEGTTLSAYIRERRLERCRVDLEDPSRAGMAIIDIASGWGFSDPSHFSRLFRAAYGLTPRAYRQQALTGA